MSDVIGSPTLNLSVKYAEMFAGLDAAQKKVAAQFGESNSRLAKAQESVMRQMQAQIDRLSGTKATGEINLIAQAVREMGGVASLSSSAVKQLTADVQRLAAAGAKVPKDLTSLTAGPSLGSRAVGAFTSLAEGGGISGALGALGPAGIAAAAGLGIVAGAATKTLEAVRALTEKSEEWTNVSFATGIGVESVQKLQDLMVGAGFEAGDLSKIMKKLSEEIASGGGNLEKYGIDMEALKGLTPEAQLQAVAKAITDIQDPMVRSAAATAAFGKGGARDLAAIKEIADGAYKSFDALGAETVKSLKDMNEQLEAAGRKWEFWKKSALVAMLDVASNVPAVVQFMMGGMAGGAVGAAAAASAQAAIARAPGGATGGGAPTPEELARQERVKKAAADELKKWADSQNKETRKIGQADSDERLKDRQRLTAELEGESLRNRNEALKDGLALEDAAAKAEDSLTVAMGGGNRELEGKIAKIREQAAAEVVGISNAYTRLAATGQATEEDLKSRDAAIANVDARTQLEEATARLDAGNKEFNEGVKKDVAEFKRLEDESKRLEQAQSQAWSKAFAGAEAFAGELAGLPGDIGKVGSAMGGMLSGAQGIKSGIADYKASETAGGLTGLLGTVGAIGSIAASAIGIGKTIVGLFKSDPVKKAQKEAGAALGHGISRDLAETLMKDAKAQGKSIAQVAKEYEAKIKATQKSDEMKTLSGGVETAKQGAETLMGVMDLLTPKAQAAGGALIKAVQDAMVANGLGYLANGALAKNESFNAAQTAVGGVTQIMSGMRTAGGVDAGLLQNAGGMAGALQQQATDAAIASGMAPAEATKVGFATIAPLLQEMLNSSISSGTKLSADQQALLDEAKKNGINIVADPLVELNATQKESLAVLRTIAGGKAGAPGAIHAAKGLGPVKMPNMGGGLGPLIQTHAGEYALILPAAMSRGGLIHAARGLYAEDDRESRGKGGGGGAGGGGDAGAGGDAGGAAPSTTLDTVAQELRSVRDAVVSAPSVTAPINVSVQVDPLMSAETREAAINDLMDAAANQLAAGSHRLSREISRMIRESRQAA